MHAIATAGGPTCEVVLHNLEGPNIDLDHTIIAIEHPHVTGRHVGGPSSSLGWDVMRSPRENHDAFGYRGFTADGRELRCSSVYFHNAAGDIIAALCINFDITAIQQARAVLGDLLTAPEPTSSDEHFGRDLVEVMDAMIDEAIRDVGKPPSLMTRADKINVLKKADEGGVTQMRKSVEVIAGRLGISRVTAYSYLDEARRQEA